MNKKQIFELLMSYYGLNKDIPHGEIKPLLEHFAPPLPKKPKTAFEWLAKATDSDPGINHPERMYVIVINGVGYATNGHIFHLAPVDLPDGSYDPRTGLKQHFEMRAGLVDIYTHQLAHRYLNDKSLTPVEELPKAKPNDGPLIKFYYEVNGLCFDKKLVDRSISAGYKELKTGKGHLAGSNEFGQFVVMCCRI